jgi:hypothetical protein
MASDGGVGVFAGGDEEQTILLRNRVDDTEGASRLRSCNKRLTRDVVFEGVTVDSS